ncbi:unnamed protein product (mitochondrion) [Plasmodiophora brassicae]|uniref:Uncharacterized protein n=1 Tax=Plasmodiophora brassicae TaxID=37360 RepID=A0A3P3YNB8_PLABS|nr:unnamed protein product [Plasmodiophora brassicae]
MDEGRVSRGKALRVPGQLHLAVDPVKGARLALDVDAGERGTASPDSIDPQTMDMIRKIANCTAKAGQYQAALADLSSPAADVGEIEKELQEMDQVFQWATWLKDSSKRMFEQRAHRG